MLERCEERFVENGVKSESSLIYFKFREELETRERFVRSNSSDVVNSNIL